MPDVQIIQGYVPGAIGRVSELHAAYYHRAWGFGLFFESRIAVGLAEFLTRYDEERDGFWTAQVDGRIEGSIAIDGLHAAAQGAHLRWFIVSDGLRGQGAGGRLMEAALGFCRSCSYRRVYLNTFEGLHAARHLYERAGFRLVAQHPGAQWGREVNEQRFELQLE
jgi:GNAT superfamily N-acetyltransferase